MSKNKEHNQILSHIYALEGPNQQGFRCLSYVIEMNTFSVLIDVANQDLDERLNLFLTPKHLILTHRHVKQHESFFERKYSLEVWLHPQDANAPRKGPAEGTSPAKKYHDPLSKKFNTLGLQSIHISGHTPGSIFIYYPENGGVLFVGDAVIGSRVNEPVKLQFPPDFTSDDQEALKAYLKKVNIPSHQHILPLHGEPLLNLSYEETENMWKILKEEL